MDNKKFEFIIEGTAESHDFRVLMNNIREVLSSQQILKIERIEIAEINEF